MNKEKNKILVDIPPINHNKKDLSLKQPKRKEDIRVDIMSNKSIEERKDSDLKDEEKIKAIFSLKSEISKVKISLLFSELVKNIEYRN